MNKLKILELFDGLKVKVSDDGDIYTLCHKDYEKLLKPKIDKYGYKNVVLTKNGKRKTYLVHRLVGQAFIPNPNNKPTINHINGIKTDNRVCNLEWATHKEQKEHQIKNGLCINNINSLKKANEKRAIPIFYNGVKYNSIREASRKLGVCQWNIKKNGEIINE